MCEIIILVIIPRSVGSVVCLRVCFIHVYLRIVGWHSKFYKVLPTYVFAEISDTTTRRGVTDLFGRLQQTPTRRV